MKPETVWPFYAGMLVQAVFLLMGQFERGDPIKLLGCFAASFLGLIPGKHEHQYDLRLHLLLVSGVFAVGYALCFKEKVLEHINKEILMVWTMVGLYIALQTPLITACPTVLIALAVFSAVPIANAFAGFDKNYGWKVYFYIWFLCVLVGIAASKFAFSTLATIFGFHHSDEELSAFTTFFVGMSFLYLVINLWYVVELIPIPGKHQSLGERLEHVEEDMAILASDYDEVQVRWWKTILLLAISGCLLTTNYFQHLMSDETLVPLLIVFLPVVDKIKLPSKAPTQSTENTGSQINPGE